MSTNWVISCMRGLDWHDRPSTNQTQILCYILNDFFFSFHWFVRGKCITIHYDTIQNFLTKISVLNASQRLTAVSATYGRFAYTVQRKANRLLTHFMTDLMLLTILFARPIFLKFMHAMQWLFWLPTMCSPGICHFSMYVRAFVFAFSTYFWMRILLSKMYIVQQMGPQR